MMPAMTTGYQVGAASQAMALVALQQAQERILRLALTPRQRQLNAWWGFFCAEQYDDRSVAWSGLRVPSLLEREGLHRQTAIPPGFYDAGHLFEHVPLEFRKPEITHHIVRQVVWRFTDMMFSRRTRPTLKVNTDPAATAWLDDLARSTALWSRCGYARNLAGAMGAVAMSFAFLDGRLVIEVHDPRWCTPVIPNKQTGDVASMEIRYMYPVESRRPDGLPVQTWYWFRRTIDASADTTFQPVEVKEGDEPIWTPAEGQTFPLPFGFCPVRWIQNTAVPSDIDGEPDCKGVFENAEAMDRLLSQGSLGASNNADPTLHVGTSDQKLGDLRKGSRHAIRTEKDGSVDYVEASGSGIDMAIRMFDKIDDVSLKAVRCIIEEEREGGPMTAEEIRRRYGAMFSRVESLQEHWSETGIVPFIEMMVRAVRQLVSGQTIDPSGRLSRTTLAGKLGALPPSVQSGALASRELGQSALMIETVWPDLAPPTAQDAQAATGAAAAAVAAKILDRRSATEYIAPKFGVRDVGEVITRLEEEARATDAALQSELLVSAGGQPGGGEITKAQDTGLNGAQIEALGALAVQAFTGALPRDAVLAQALLAFPMAPPALLERAIPQPAPVVDPATGLPVPVPPAPVVPIAAPPAPVV